MDGITDYRERAESTARALKEKANGSGASWKVEICGTWV